MKLKWDVLHPCCLLLESVTQIAVGSPQTQTLSVCCLFMCFLPVGTVMGKYSMYTSGCTAPPESRVREIKDAVHTAWETESASLVLGWQNANVPADVMYRENAAECKQRGDTSPKTCGIRLAQPLLSKAADISGMHRWYVFTTSNRDGAAPEESARSPCYLITGTTGKQNEIKTQSSDIVTSYYRILGNGAGAAFLDQRKSNNADGR